MAPFGKELRPLPVPASELTNRHFRHAPPFDDTQLLSL
jgi:hypothetical protein